MERIKKGKMTVVQVLFFVHSYIRLNFQFMRTGFMNKTNQIDNYLTSSFWKDGECLKESDRHEIWHVGSCICSAAAILYRSNSKI